ncbi:MAG: nucleotide exchange factor GrpE [Prevotella sp.]|nr:nucleotide exchange factor GrpE [Prevotella sp.]
MGTSDADSSINDEKKETSKQKDNNLGEETLDSSKDSQEEKIEIDPLEEAKKNLETLNDKYLRLAAEFDNYRKRTIKEKAELILNGSKRAIQAILPIIDDMERALAITDKTSEEASLKEGLKLIHQKMIKSLEGLGVSEIDTIDADFNTDFHEAIAMVPGVEDEKKGKVLDCVQKGYKLNEDVIRHAKVAVGQ